MCIRHGFWLPWKHAYQGWAAKRLHCSPIFLIFLHRCEQRFSILSTCNKLIWLCCSRLNHDITTVSLGNSAVWTPSRINNFCAAILYYDYFLTLPDEVDRFWSSRRVTWASTFFYINRYLTLIGHSSVAFGYYWSLTNVSQLNVCTNFVFSSEHIKFNLAGVRSPFFQGFCSFECFRTTDVYTFWLIINTSPL